MTRVYIGLGSNMGNRVEHLHQALTRLDTLFELDQLSPVYETPPKYVEDQSPFLNMSVSGETSLNPLQLLAQLKALEIEIGRMPSEERYGPRIIDLDILFFGNIVVAKLELSIPHPLMPEREFVLRPLADIAAGFRHPVSGQTVVQMLAALEGQPEASLFVIDV
jgi:2-amino-4-hydroxy-6-hydroxymethyldihydropteridine diphosphokinase